MRKALLRERARVVLHDPHIAGLDSDLGAILKDVDLILVATNHAAYQDLDLATLRKMVGGDCVVCDIWNLFGTQQIIFNIDAALTAGTASTAGATAAG